MTKPMKCTYKQLMAWLDKHLDDCPTDWEVDDYSGREGISIVFNIEEDS